MSASTESPRPRSLVLATAAAVVIAALCLPSCGNLSLESLETGEGGIRGRALQLDTGLPASGVSVSAEAQAGSLRTSMTDDDGWFVLVGLPAGKVDLHLSGPWGGHSSFAYIIVDGLLVDVADVLFAGNGVAVGSVAVPGPSIPSPLTVGAKGNAEFQLLAEPGPFELPLPPGKHTLQAQAAGYAPVEVLVTISGGQITDLGELLVTECAEGRRPGPCGTCGPPPEETCDGVDNDCDGELPADELDKDGDGVIVCRQDCDDANSLVFPGAPELCDGIDNDCDGVLPWNEQDVDGDGVSACEGDCDDQEPMSFPDAPEVCDGKDNDCDGSVPETEYDLDGDGYAACGGDCDDSEQSVHPTAPEVCDGLDNDCSPETDESGLTAPCSSPCGSGERYCVAGDWGECNLTEPNPEVCDGGVDNDCDGLPETGICEIGELCLVDLNCVDGLTCRTHGEFNRCTTSCTNTGMCPQGFMCSPESPGNAPGLCWPFSSAGWPPGSPCESTSDCASGLCWPSVGVCGDLCSSLPDCPDGWSCRLETMEDLSTGQPIAHTWCVVPQGKAEPYATCAANSDCEGNVCAGTDNGAAIGFCAEPCCGNPDCAELDLDSGCGPGVECAQLLVVHDETEIGMHACLPAPVGTD